MNEPLIMTEEYWANSQLSTARYYGGINFNGKRYVIVNKEGKDVWQCTEEAKKAGRNKAIEPGEPADLCIYSLVQLIGMWLDEKGSISLSEQVALGFAYDKLSVYLQQKEE